MPGRPVTEENFKKWFDDYIAKHNIKLVLEDDWTKVDLTKEMSSDFTGYEYFKRKMAEQKSEF